MLITADETFLPSWTTLSLALPLDLSSLGGPTRSLCSRQHSSRNHRSTQGSPPRQGGSPRRALLLLLLLEQYFNRSAPLTVVIFREALHTYCIYINYNINISQSKEKLQTNDKNKQTKSDIKLVCITSPLLSDLLNAVKVVDCRTFSSKLFQSIAA